MCWADMPLATDENDIATGPEHPQTTAAMQAA